MEGHFARHRLNFGNALGHEVVVFDRHQGQEGARERRHFACPQPGRVDHVLGPACPLGGDHLPPAVREWVGLLDRALPVDNGAQLSGRCGEGVGHSARIDVAPARLVEHAFHVLEVEDRSDVERLRFGQKLRFQAEAKGLRLVHRQLFQAGPGSREGESTGVVETAGLPALLLQRRIELEAVLLQESHVGVTGERAGAAGCVP